MKFMNDGMFSMQQYYMRNTNPIISIIIPCYNEEGGLKELYKTLKDEVLKNIDYQLIFINDGSSDKTIDVLKDIVEKDLNAKYLSFSRNFGHQNALKAGYDYASGNCVISMDADLQHPPFLLNQMIEKWQEGYDIVYAVRDDKKTKILKRITSYFFYKLVNLLSETKIHPNVADFRLIDRNVRDELVKINENNLFLRGIISWLGYNYTYLHYLPNERFDGKTKYSLMRMIKFASTGITSFSTKPLKISIFFGVIFALLAFSYGIYALFVSIFTEKTIEGWTSILVSVVFIGGIQLIMIGILGEYLGKLFIENKKRPNYIIEETNIVNE